MRSSRGRVILVAVGVGVALAACGGSNKPTGPSSSQTATTIDSQYAVDTAGGHGNKAAVDGFILLSVDEGAEPTSVSVTTDSGALAMQAIGATLYDTSSAGAVTDSSLILVAWTADYNIYVVTFFSGVAGPDFIPRHRIAVSAKELATMRAFVGRPAATGEVLARAGVTASAIEVEGDSAVQADSASITASEAPSSQGCVYQHIQFNNLFNVNDSTALCNRVTITESFALHFVPNAGVSPGLAHMSLTPAQTLQAARLALTAP